MLSQYKREYDLLEEKCNLKGREALEAVKKNGYALMYVNEQTPEICLEAVKEDGYALQFVNEQTPDICLEAVKQEGDALQFVKENMFINEDEIEIDGKMFSKSTIKNALKDYINK